MSWSRGSWLPLLVLAVAFLSLFWWQRDRSVFLQVEQQRPLAAELAAQHDLAVADVLALRDMVGLAASVDRWRRAAALLAGELAIAATSAGGPVGSLAGRAGAGASRALGSPGTVATDHSLADLQAVRSALLERAIAKVAQDRLAARRFVLLRERFAARH